MDAVAAKRSPVTSFVMLNPKGKEVSVIMRSDQRSVFDRVSQRPLTIVKSQHRINWVIEFIGRDDFVGEESGEA